MEHWVRLSDNLEYDELHKRVEQGGGAALLDELLERECFTRTELAWALEALQLLAADRCEEEAERVEASGQPAADDPTVSGWSQFHWVLRIGWSLADGAGVYLTESQLASLTAQLQILMHLWREPLGTWMEGQAAASE